VLLFEQLNTISHSTLSGQNAGYVCGGIYFDPYKSGADLIAVFQSGLIKGEDPEFNTHDSSKTIHSLPQLQKTHQLV